MNLKCLNLKNKEDYIRLLSKASDYYYNNGEYFCFKGIVITDDLFDEIQDQFRKRFPNDSFNKNIGASTKKTLFKKVNHSIPMGSLQKNNSFEDLKIWQIKNNPKGDIVWSEKIDGLSISLIYKNGKLAQAITRGNGLVGDDVTQNVLKMSVPISLPVAKDFTIRGEIVLHKSNFRTYFKDSVNPRNAAVGTVKRLDGKNNEHLTIYVYNIHSDDYNFRTLSSKLEFLSNKLNMNVPKWGRVSSLDEVKIVWEKYESSVRDISEYEMDGLVVSFDSIDVQKEMGEVDNRPKYAKAYKFTSKVAESTLLNVEWQVGRTGRVTPIARISPVFIGGAKISNVTLHNWSEIQRLGLQINQVVKVRRSGDVIPQIVGTIGKGTARLEAPNECPVCLKTLKKEEIFIVCTNDKCPARQYESLLFWVRTLDIKGFGQELVDQLIKDNKLKEPADFYKLKLKDISNLENRGEKIAEKVLKELNSKTTINVETFIKALGIPNIGKGTVELVILKHSTLEQMRNIKNISELTSINGIGKTTAKDFIEGIKSRSKIIDNLLKYIKIESKAVIKNGKFSGKSFCFTGLRDNKLEEQIKAEGGKIVSCVTKDLSFLVAKDPEESSSKIFKAKLNNIPIITSEYFKTNFI